MAAVAPRRPSAVAPVYGMGLWRAVAVLAAVLMALVYVLVFAGVLSVGRAEVGDLGVLGFAGGMFAVLAVLLWTWRSRLLWFAAAVLQVLMGAMYVAVAPEREPSYEVWGLTLRALSFVLFVALLMMLVEAFRRRSRA